MNKYKIISEEQFKKFTNIDDIPISFNRKRIEFEYQRLINNLENIKDTTTLEYNKKYKIIYYESINLGSLKWTDYTKQVQIDYMTFIKDTKCYLYENSNKIQKNKIICVIEN